MADGIPPFFVHMTMASVPPVLEKVSTWRLILFFWATVLAEECNPLEQLDAELAWDLLQQAYKLPRQTDEQIAVRDEAIHAARIRFSLAQKARKGMMSMEQMMSRGVDESNGE